MNPFFFLSVLFHAVLLLLLLFWEIPLAGRLLASRVIEVSLREEINEKPLLRVLTPIPKQREQIKKIEKQDVLPPPEKKQKEERTEEKKEEKKEQAKATVEEEKRKGNEQMASPTEFWTAKVEVPSEGSQPIKPSIQEVGPGEAGNPGANLGPESKAGEGAGTFFMTPPDAPVGTGKEGVPLGSGSQPPGLGREEKSPPQTAKILPSPSGIDSTLSLIIRKIEAAKRYPRIARRMGIEGTTVVRFKLKPNGHIESVAIAESSGSEILDKASLDTIRDAAPLPYKDGWLRVGIVFKIT